MSTEILMFTSPSCSGCKVMKPFVEELSNARIVDVTEDHETAAQYLVRGDLPVFIKLVDGEYDSRTSGAMNKARFLTWVSER